MVEDDWDQNYGNNHSNSVCSVISITNKTFIARQNVFPLGGWLDGNALFAVQMLFFDSKPNINESQTGWKRLKRWKQNYLKMYIIIEIRLTIETDQAATNT